MSDNDFKPLGAVKYNVKTTIAGKPPTFSKGKKRSGQGTYSGNIHEASTLLGKDIKTGEDVWITQEARRSSLYILGATGSGKSVLISHMCAQDMRQKVRLAQGEVFKIGMCVIAPDSDLFDAILARVPADREQDVILLDVIELAKQGQFFGLNLFYCSNPADVTTFELTVEQVHGVFEKVFHMSSETTPRLEEYVQAITRTFIGTPYTMTEIASLLLNDAFRRMVVNPSSDFWQEYEAMRPQERKEEYRSTFTRVRRLTDNQMLRYTVGQNKLFDFSEAINKSKIVLVRLPGEYGDLGKLLGSILLGQLLQAALKQDDLPKNKRPYFNLYIDEFQDYVTPSINKLLVQARKFHVGSVISHQSLYQDGITDEIRATTRQVPNKVFFNLSNTDAEEVASIFDITPPQAKKPEPTIPSNVLEHLHNHKYPEVRKFYTKYVRRWQEAARKQADKQRNRGDRIGEDGLPLPKYRIDYPQADLGAGVVDYDPDPLKNALLLMNDLFYETQITGKIDTEMRDELVWLTSNVLDTAFVNALDEVLFILTQDNGRIPVPSTEWVETVISQQVRSDKKLEIANQLTHLKRGHAMIRVPDGEFLIETADPIRIPNIKDKRDRLLKQTIRNYCKSQAEVEREIAKRVSKSQLPTQRKNTI